MCNYKKCGKKIFCCNFSVNYSADHCRRVGDEDGEVGGGTYGIGNSNHVCDESHGDAVFRREIKRD